MSDAPRRTAAITAVGAYLPPDRLTNADLEKMVETSDEWIRTRTGIEERRILRDPTKATAFMATEAARQCLDRRGLDASEVDLIIVGTVTADMHFPASANLVQDALGATNAWGFDLSAACSGFLFSLTTAARMIESGAYRNALVIGADTMSRIMDYTDRTTCIIFGDGAGAVLLEANDEGLGLLDAVHYTDGSGAEHLRMDGGGSLHPPTHATVDAGMHALYQDGKSVFKRAVAGMADSAAEIMERNHLAPEDVRYLVPHQANLRIIEATARRMGVEMDKVMVNISRYGNTTSGTIPLCLWDWEPELKRGDTLVLAAFGGGYTWGATYLKWAYDGSKGEGPSEKGEGRA